MFINADRLRKLAEVVACARLELMDAEGRTVGGVGAADSAQHVDRAEAALLEYLRGIVGETVETTDNVPWHLRSPRENFPTPYVNFLGLPPLRRLV